MTPGHFYLFMLNKGVFRTTDGGDTWAQVSDYQPFARSSYDYHTALTAVPGREGHLFLTPGPLQGVTTVLLRRSTDGGRTWTDVAGVSGVSAVGFSKAFAGQAYPSTIYIVGYVNGLYGIYRSGDEAATWQRLGDYPGGKTGIIRDIEGDKDVAGRFYLGIQGGGWMRGDSGSPLGDVPTTTTPTTITPIATTPTTTALTTTAPTTPTTTGSSATNLRAAILRLFGLAP